MRLIFHEIFVYLWIRTFSVKIKKMAFYHISTSTKPDSSDDYMISTYFIYRTPQFEKLFCIYF